MTKKQQKEIALMWSASVIYQAGMDSFDDTDSNDSGKIVEFAQELAIKILRNRPLLTDLSDIIKYVIANK